MQRLGFWNQLTSGNWVVTLSTILKASFAVLQVQQTVTRVQNVIEKIFMLTVVIQALKNSVMFLNTPFANSCLICKDWAFEITLQPYWIHPVQIHLIEIRDSPDHRRVRNKEVIISLYIFTLWGRDLESVVRIRESPYYRGFLKENIWEFCRDFGNCPYWRGVRTERFDCIWAQYLHWYRSYYRSCHVSNWVVVQKVTRLFESVHLGGLYIVDRKTWK